LFGQTRGALLSLLYGKTDQAFYLRQLARMTGAGHGAVQRELKQLTEMGLILRSTQGNQVLYRANRRSPIFPEVKSLMTKTVGLHDTIRSALTRISGKIQIAFVFGSFARGEERSDSDVDLMIVGKVSFGEAVAALAPAQKALGREINPSLFSAGEFRAKLAADNHFLNSVMRGKKLFVIGTPDELTKLAAK